MFQEGLAMVVQDPLLCDLPIQVTLEEVNSQIALEYGQAMTVRVCKMDGEVMPVVVVQNATVLDLKKALQRREANRGQKEAPRLWYPESRRGFLHQKAEAKVNLQQGQLYTLVIPPFQQHEPFCCWASLPGQNCRPEPRGFGTWTGQACSCFAVNLA